MADLLAVAEYRLPPDAKDKGTPTFAEFAISPEVSPVLVSALTRPAIWVEKTHTGKARAAFRTGRPGDYYAELIGEFQERSRRKRWGSSLTLTSMGVRTGLQYLASYELTDVEILCSEDTEEFLTQDLDWSVVESDPLDITVVPWLQGMAIIVPVDRNYLGWIAYVEGEEDVFTSIVHNAARGIVILS